LEAKDGLMPVPEGPGIGVSLDWEHISKIRSGGFTLGS